MAYVILSAGKLLCDQQEAIYKAMGAESVVGSRKTPIWDASQSSIPKRLAYAYQVRYLRHVHVLKMPRRFSTLVFHERFGEKYVGYLDDPVTAENAKRIQKLCEDIAMFRQLDRQPSVAFPEPFRSNFTDAVIAFPEIEREASKALEPFRERVRQAVQAKIQEWDAEIGLLR
jgi:hypothetical protein